MASFLLLVGMALAVVSGFFFHSAFSIETTVISAEAPAGFDGVANLQLMHFQVLQMLVGVGSAIVSAILIVGAEICFRLDAAKDAMSAD